MTPALYRKFYTGPMQGRVSHRHLAEESFTGDNVGYASTVSAVYADPQGNVSRCGGMYSAWRLEGVLSLTIADPAALGREDRLDASSSLSTGSPAPRTRSSVPVEEAS